MSEIEKIEYSDDEVIELMSQITFNLGAVIMNMRDSLGRYNKLPNIKEKNEENIKKQLNNFTIAIDKLGSNIELIRNKTNYQGVEELLKLEIEFFKALSSLIENIKKDPFKFAKAWRTGNQDDLSQSFEKINLLEERYQSLELFRRYSQLADKSGGRKKMEMIIR